MKIRKPATADALIDTSYRTNSISNNYDKVFYTSKSGFKGHKININQYRKKKSLKNQFIMNHQRNQYYSVANSINYTIEQTEQFQNMNYSTSLGRQRIKPRKTVQTADGFGCNRRRMKQLQNQVIMKQQNKTMHIAANNYFDSSMSNNIKKNIVFFQSQNLDNKMNQYMNIFIREPINNSMEVHNIISRDQISAQKSISSYARRIKTSKKKRDKKVFENNRQGIQDREKGYIELGKMYKTLDTANAKQQNSKITRSQRRVAIAKLRDKLVNRSNWV